MKALITGIKICKNCGKEFKRNKMPSGRLEDIKDFNERKFCSIKCSGEFRRGKNHPNWKGGIKHRPDGYLRNSKTDKYIHRETMESYLGRKLLPEEFIHHKNGNKGDNRIENLEIHTNSSHRKLEVKKQKRNFLGRFFK